MVNVQVKEVSGAVLIFGLSSQPIALQLCDRLKQEGIKTTIGMLTGISGYQVSVYGRSVAEVKDMLPKVGADVQDE